jgi:hypothetical protein
MNCLKTNKKKQRLDDMAAFSLAASRPGWKFGRLKSCRLPSNFAKPSNNSVCAACAVDGEIEQREVLPSDLPLP